MTFRSLAGPLAALSLLACRPAPEDAEETPTTDTEVEDEPSNDTDEADTNADTDETNTCSRTGFTPVAQDSGVLTGMFRYIAQSTLGVPVDVLYFFLDPNQGGAQEAGTYAITDANYKTCANCIVIDQGCDENLVNCEKYFLANTGSLVISNFGTERFSGILDNAEFVEVTIDEDLTSTPVIDGEKWCVDDYAFDASVQ